MKFRAEASRRELAGLRLIDFTLPNRLKVENICWLLDNYTLLIALEGQAVSPVKIALALLEIPEISFPGIHREMPNKALGEVSEFYKKHTR